MDQTKALNALGDRVGHECCDELSTLQRKRGDRCLYFARAADRPADGPTQREPAYTCPSVYIFILALLRTLDVLLRSGAATTWFMHSVRWIKTAQGCVDIQQEQIRGTSASVSRMTAVEPTFGATYHDATSSKSASPRTSLMAPVPGRRLGKSLLPTYLSSSKTQTYTEPPPDPRLSPIERPLYLGLLWARSSQQHSPPA